MTKIATSPKIIDVHTAHPDRVPELTAQLADIEARRVLIAQTVVAASQATIQSQLR